MNRCRSVGIASVLGFAAAGLGVDATAARGQAAPAAAGPAWIPVATLAAAQKATNATPFRPQIKAFIDSHVAGLQSANLVAQRAARDALRAGCPRGRNGTLITTSYYSNYAGLLATAAGPLLAPTQKLPLRVSLGVVVADVAENGSSLLLVPVVETMLADPSAAVSLYGAKAAQPLVTALVLQPGGPGAGASLFKGLVDAVADPRHKEFSGYIAAEAYRALLVEPGVHQGMAANALIPLYDPILDLVAVRTKQYADGVVPVPEAEQLMPTWISRDFATLPDDKQKRRCLQALLNLIDAAGGRAPLVPKSENLELRSLLNVVTRSAQAIDVMFDKVAGRPGTPLANLARLSISSSGDQIAAQSALAYTNLTTASPAVAAMLVKPPTLPPMSPPPPPSSPSMSPGGGPAAGGR